VFGDTLVTVMGIVMGETVEGVKPFESITYMAHTPPTGGQDNEHII
jgi:hypothetical protein